MHRFLTRSDPGKRGQKLGEKLFDQRRYQDAEKEFRGALPGRCESLGENHVDTLNSKHWLGRSLYYQAKQIEAEKYFRQAAQGREKTLGSDDINTLDSKHGLGSSLYDQGKYAEAEDYLRQAAEGRATRLGQDDINTYYSKYWLGRSLYSQKKYAEAEGYFQQVAQGREKTLGQDDVNTIDVKFWRGASLHNQGKFVEAEECFRQAAQGQEKILGQDNAATLGTKHCLGRLLYDQKKYVEAEEYFRQAVQGQEKTLGRDNAATLGTKHWLGRSLYDQKKYVEAEEYFRQAAQGQEKTLGQDNANTINSREMLAKSISEQQTRTDTDENDSQEIESNRATNEGTTSILQRSQSPANVTPLSLPLMTVNNRPRQLNCSSLDDFFTDNGGRRSIYSDSEISEISSLLEQFNTKWSKVPRTYIVLRTINCLHLLDNFIASGFSDYWFPAASTNLPSVLRPSQVVDFVNNQHLVLTKSLDLEKRTGGRHCYFDQDETLPLEKKRILGRGGFGQVDEVLSLISYKKYARKRVLRRSIFRAQKPEHLRLFITEIETLKRLNHKHIIDFIGSYSDTKYLGLLMYPVAEMDLSTYLMRRDLSNHFGELRTFFGCLTAALDYLHTQHVLHTDIKPENVLVNCGNVLLTDFGLCYEFKDAQCSTTISMVNGMTPRYCAPEIALFEPRGTSCDIWSLGVVFLEMLVVLKGQTIAYMDQYFREHGSHSPLIWRNPDGLLQLIVALKVMGNPGDNVVIEWINEMLQEERKARPTASSLLATINNPSEDGRGTNRFCGICCVPYNDDDDDDFSD